MNSLLDYTYVTTYLRILLYRMRLVLNVTLKRWANTATPHLHRRWPVNLSQFLQSQRGLAVVRTSS